MGVASRPCARALRPQDLNRRRCYWRHIGAGGGWKSRTVEREAAGRVGWRSCRRRHRHLSIPPHRPTLSSFWRCSGVLGAALQPHTSRGWFRLLREPVFAQERLRRGAKPERTAGAAGASPGGAAPEEAEEPPPPTRLAWAAATAPPALAPAGPGHCPCRGGSSSGGGSTPLAGAPPPAFPLLSRSVRLFSGPRSAPLPSSSPSRPYTSPTPRPWRAEPLWNGLWISTRCWARRPRSGGDVRHCRRPPRLPPPRRRPPRPPPPPSRPPPPRRRSISEWSHLPSAMSPPASPQVGLGPSAAVGGGGERTGGPGPRPRDWAARPPPCLAEPSGDHSSFHELLQPRRHNGNGLGGGVGRGGG